MSQTNGEVVPVAEEKINTNIVTLTRFLTEEQTKHKEATGDFTYVFNPCFLTIRHANTHFQVCYAMLYSSPSSPLPTISAEPVS